MQTRAVDDALDLLDVLIASLGVLLEVTGAHDDLAEQPTDDSSVVEPVSLAQVWAEIEAVVSHSELADALTAVVELAGPPDSDADEA